MPSGLPQLRRRDPVLHFQPLIPDESGLEMPKDCRALPCNPSLWSLLPSGLELAGSITTGSVSNGRQHITLIAKD